MENKIKNLTAKEKAFCNCFVSCGSADEAAYNAGYVKNPKRSVNCPKLIRQYKKSLLDVVN